MSWKTKLNQFTKKYSPKLSTGKTLPSLKLNRTIIKSTLICMILYFKNQLQIEEISNFVKVLIMLLFYSKTIYFNEFQIFILFILGKVSHLSRVWKLVKWIHLGWFISCYRIYYDLTWTIPKYILWMHPIQNDLVIKLSFANFPWFYS